MSEMMKLTIKPLLTIKPGSIAGQGGTFSIGFSVVEHQNLTNFNVKYQILNAAGYRFKAPAAADFPIFYQVSADGMAATGFMGAKPKQGPWKQDVLIEQDASFDGKKAAALKIAATVNGQGKGTLAAVFAVGSIAMLSGGLTKLVEEHFETHEVPPGVTDFEGRARAFVRAKQAELKGRFKDFDDLDPRTIVNAILDKTNPRSSTIESLSPVIKHFRNLVKFPAKFGKNSAER